jgi:hypothetical protein
MTITRTKDERTEPSPQQLQRLRPRRVLVAAQVIGGALLAVGIVLAIFLSNAEASTLAAGPVTLSPGSPYHSGQVIDITVRANTTLAEASRAAEGFPSGAVAIKVVECADPGGLAANLPTKPTGCDYNTVDSIPGAQVNGSLLITGYTVYALPDAIVFGEPVDQTPICGTGNNQCVLGLFTNLHDFTKPHIFSGAFEVTPDPKADNAIVNGAPSSTTPSTPSSPTTAAGVTTAAPVLANTGVNPGSLWMIGGGSALLFAGTLGRRRLRRQRGVAPARLTANSQGR